MASCDMDAAATETILEIFCNLDSLSDVFSLSATSWRFRWIWLVHSDYIYRRVGRRSIEGEKHAHALQMAISGNKKVTPNDATTIFHRAEELDCIIEKFDDKVVSKNTCRGKNPVPARWQHRPLTQHRFTLQPYQVAGT
ncbi:hypothetical protein EJ04DRAFT_528288 [Polyplosphaeria fusca]|uniref:F-box domain-containing protein n=1 Tax=Polyplosphaeria fusca TaxID=682080 RepID=A0A9P4QM37_9PLEO|nr:hypothetical protein EJ04DRAFT_528288 [Polyplosphaeria fusca]